MIAKYLSGFILWLAGWKLDIRVPSDKKYVIIVAPHTSNWDFIIGKLVSWVAGIKPKVLVKKEAFNVVSRPFILMWGGIPVDRSNTADLLEQVFKLFEENDEFALSLTPEGTRKRNPNWKTGFYRIAVKASVPIYLAYIDYGTRQAGFHQKYVPTGDMDLDIKKIKSYYKDMKGKYPDRFALE